MAVVKLNPLFSSARGRWGDMVLYPRWGKVCARMYVIPRNPDTPAQRITREGFALAVKSWQDMPGEEKYRFNRKARNLNMSGYNLYISEYLKKRISSVSRPEEVQTVYSKEHPESIQSRIHSVSYPERPAFKETAPLTAPQYNSG